MPKSEKKRYSVDWQVEKHAKKFIIIGRSTGKTPKYGSKLIKH